MGNNVFEFKLQVGSKSVDYSSSEMAADFKDFLSKAKQNLADLTQEIEESTVYKKAKKALDKFPLIADPVHFTLTVGNVSFQTTKEQYESCKQSLDKTIHAANEELASSDAAKKLEEDAALNASKKESNEFKDDVQHPRLEKRRTGNVEYDYDPKTGISTFNFNDWIVLKNSDAATSVMQEPEDEYQSRDVRVWERRHERHMNIKNEHRKAKKLEKDARKAEKLNENMSRQRDALANSAVNVMGSAEKKKQSGYYDLVIRQALEEFKKNRYNANDVVYIKSYSPLFSVPGSNPDGIVGIRMSPDDVIAYAAETSGDSPDRQQSAENGVNTFDKIYPGSKQTYKDKGVIGMLFNGVADKTNLKQKDANTIANLCKLATSGALLFFGIRSIIDLFSKEKRKRGLTTLGIMAGLELGSRMAFGEGINGLLNSKDPKKAWKDFCDKFNLGSSGIDNLDKNTIDQVMDPAAVHAMLSNISWDAQKQFVTQNADGSVDIDQTKYEQYITARSALDPTFASTADNRRQAMKILVEKSSLTTNVRQYYKANGFTPYTVDATHSKETPEKEFISTTEIRNKIMEVRKGYTVDADKMADYIAKVKKNKIDINTITVETLKKEEVINGRLAKEVLDTDPVDPALQPLVDANKMTKIDAQGLTKAKDQVTDELKQEGKQDASKDMLFVVKGDVVYLHSHGWETSISKVGALNEWKVSSFDHIFSGTYEAVRVATLTNFIVTHYKGTVDKDVKAPFSYNGHNLNIRQHAAGTDFLNLNVGAALRGTTVVDGADGFSSSLQKIGGSAFEAQAGSYALWLNRMQGIDGKSSMWYTGNAEGVTPEAIVLLPIAAVTAGNTNTNTNTNNPQPNAPTNNPTNNPANNNNAPNAAPNAAPNSGKSRFESTKEEAAKKWEQFKKDVDDVSKNLKKYLKDLFNIKDDSNAVKNLKAQVQKEKNKLIDLKKQLGLLEDLEEMKRKEIADDKEIGRLKAIIQEEDNRIAKIEKMLAGEYVDPALGIKVIEVKTGTGKNQKTEFKFENASPDPLPNIPLEKKLELNRAEKELNADLKFNTENDEARFVVDNNKLYLQSCGQRSLITVSTSDYYMDSYRVGFQDAESAIRLANLTNFIKANFADRATTNVEKPWFIANDGDLTFDPKTSWDALKKGDFIGFAFNTTVVDGEDRFKSTFKRLGGTVLESQKGAYADYLNFLKNDNNESLWVMKNEKGMMPDELKTLESKFAEHLKVIQKGPLRRPERPDDYKGHEDITDEKAELDSKGGYLALKSHTKEINIVPSNKIVGGISKTGYQIGYVNVDASQEKLGGNYLEIAFPTELEAIKVANLINFYKHVYAGYGTSSKSFNISSVQGGLEFAEDGFMDGIDLNALGSTSAVEKYSSQFNAQGLSILCDWLNEMEGREAK